MKQLVCVHPGSFQYSDVDPPRPAPAMSIIRIKRIGICGTDIHAFDGTQPYFSYPRVLGHELGCEFMEGDGAAGFEPGEEVTIIPYLHCGHCGACRSGKTNCCQQLRVLGVHADGGMTEFLSVPSYTLMHSNGLSLDSLALIEPLAVAAHGVAKAAITPGEFVLVFGAGPIGLGAMSVATIAGARVIAVDVNEKRLQFCRKHLEVPFALNGLDPELEAQVKEITKGDMPGVVIDATGSLSCINQGFRFMAHGGRYVLIGLQKGDITFSHPEFHKREGTLMSSRNATRSDFEWVMETINRGSLDPRKFITHRIPFHEVKEVFAPLLQTGEVIKGMIEVD